MSYKETMNQFSIKIGKETIKTTEASEKQLLIKQILMLKETYNIQKRIMNNVVFWFWVFWASFALYIIAEVLPR